MIKYKHSVNIHAHKRKNSDKCNLFLVVSVNGKRKEVPSGISTLASAYDSKRMIIKNKYANASLDNFNLQSQLSEINKIFMQHEISSNEPTLDTILTDIDKVLHPNEYKPEIKASTVTVLEAFDKYIDVEKINSGWTEGTCRHKNVIKHHLINIIDNKLKLADVTDDVLLYITEKLSTQLRANTLDKFLSDMRTFLRWCNNKDLYFGHSHDTFYPSIKGANDAKEIIYLTFDELKMLESYHWRANQQYLERAVDSFLFACFCGLRHSDVYNLTRSKIYDDAIHVRTKKTGTNIDLPLNVHTRRILDKYKDYQDKRNRPFPVASDQKSNKYIKEACQIVGITQPLTISYTKNGRVIEETKPKNEWIAFHCARRTFISIAFMLGIPAEIIIKFTGHSSLKHLKPYLAISEKHRREKMNLFDTI